MFGHKRVFRRRRERENAADVWIYSARIVWDLKFHCLCYAKWLGNEKRTTKQNKCKTCVFHGSCHHETWRYVKFYRKNVLYEMSNIQRDCYECYQQHRFNSLQIVCRLDYRTIFNVGSSTIWYIITASPIRQIRHRSDVLVKQQTSRYSRKNEGWVF